MTVRYQIEKTAQALDHWLRPDNHILAKAIERTAEEGYFCLTDIRHRIRSIKSNTTREELERWVGNTLNPDDRLPEKDVLCLHAGNLPLVGLQDLLACAITGAKYFGKVSKKDPYLLESLIVELERTGALMNPVYSTDLKEMKGAAPDSILFAGSERSLEPLRRRLRQLEISTDSARMLIRTAHFSIAYIEHLDQQRLRELVEAVFRYSGTGCRSVAVLITPEPMRESICHFTDTVEEFWIRNPQHKKPTKSLYHRYAYNRAIKREQAWLDDFLIEKSRMYPHQPFIMHWIEGDRSDAESFIREYGDGLQSVYRSRIEAIDDSIAGRIVEPIDSAQNPPIDWTPDGIDPIEWLVSERPHEELR